MSERQDQFTNSDTNPAVRNLFRVCNSTEFDLPAKHPGYSDANYRARRKELFDLCRFHRMTHKGPPLIDYTEAETRVWRDVAPKLDDLHKEFAGSIYLDAKRRLGISQTEIPQLRYLSEILKHNTSIALVPVEGAIPYRDFYSYVVRRQFPVTQFIRHSSQPQFTNESDLIHNCLGHIPPLMNRDYAELLVLLGRAASLISDPDQLRALQRFSWFTIEFGLIEEQGAVKIFGAGILSSVSEITFSLSDRVERRAFELERVISTDYDPFAMQDKLYVIPSFKFLRAEAGRLVESFGIVGSKKSDQLVS